MTATPGQLVDCVAECFAMPRVQVMQMDRLLAPAGLRTMTGGRGKNAPKMSSRDAAHVLIAAAASRSIRDAPDMVRMFGELPLSPNQESIPAEEALNLSTVQGDSGDQTFSRALAALISSIRKGEFNAALQERQAMQPDIPMPVTVRVELFQPWPQARIEVYHSKRCLSLNFDRNPDFRGAGAVDEFMRRSSDSPGGDLQHRAEFGLRSIRAIAELLGPEARA